MYNGSTPWLHLTGKSQCIIITVGTLAIMDIHQNIICQFLVWIVSPKFSTTKILYHTIINLAMNRHRIYSS